MLEHRRSKKFYVALMIFAAGSSISCRKGGNVTASQGPASPVSAISAPVIVSPALTPYYSKDSTLLISGICQSGSVVTLTGSATAELACADSAFQFTVQKPDDGIYTFLVAQNYSNPTALVWIHKSSVAQPIITEPASSPFASGKPNLTIAGSCETGATISLSGDAAGSVTCANSAFSIEVPKAADGNYTIQVTQTDGAGNQASASLVWQKHSLQISPNNPYLVVQTPQVLSISGGSGTYSASITVNNSGASYDSATRTYTPGTLAGVVDTVVVADSLGNTGTIYITTVAGAADHFVLPATGSGASQTALVGQAFADPLKVQLVDRYGNGLAAQPLLFSLAAGDAVFTSPTLVVSDSSGFAQVSVRAGYSSVANLVSAAPLSGTLPDLAGSGHATMLVPLTTSNLGTGQLGSLFSVAQNPSAMVVRDFNGDGFMDVAILNVGDSSAGILLGRGNGLLGAMTKVKPLCGGPNSIEAGDVNGDSKIDLVIACSGTNKIVVLIGNGAGSFTHATGSPFSTNANETIPTAAVIGDFDHDGHADLAVASAGGAIVGIWRGDGSGQFAVPAPTSEHSIGQSPSSMVATDLNKDGYLDLAIANSADDTMSVLMNSAGAGFAAQVTYGTGSNPSALAVGDFDADSYPDLAVVENGSSQVSVFMNDQTGALLFQSSSAVGTSPTWLTAGDFNGDGKQDIAVINNGDNAVNLLTGAGNGNFVTEAAVTVVTNPLFVSAADMNADGNLDLVISGNTDQYVQVLIGHGSGAFGLTTATGVNPSAAVSADFDGDGLPDLAVVNKGANTVSLFKGKGNGFYSSLGTIATGNTPVAVRAVDFNLDNKIDLAVVNSGAGTVRVYLGNGDGSFTTGVNYGVGSSPADLVVQDLNRDGTPDIVVCNSSSSTVSVLRGIGDGSFYTKVDYQTGTGPAAVIAADINGDERIDIVVASQIANTVGVLLGNGDGTLQAESVYPSGLSPFGLVSGDVNGDGIVDIITGNTVDNTVSVLLGNGDGSLRTKNDYSAGATINGLALGDVSGDGRLDLLVLNGPSLGLTLLPGNSSGQFNSQVTIPTSFNPTGVLVADPNKDGAIDALVFEGASDTIYTFLGH